MTTPTPEELLRLARKAYGEAIAKYGDKETLEGLLLIERTAFGVLPRASAALYVALGVLSGELDVAALLEERDRLRAYIERVRDAEFRSGGDLAPVSKVLQEDT